MERLSRIEESASRNVEKRGDNDVNGGEEESDSEGVESPPMLRPDDWFKQDQGWELTWPIWHMLPWQERKALAKRYGYNNIGAFEEYMTLQRAVGDSEDVSQQPYSSNLAYSNATSEADAVSKEVQKVKLKSVDAYDDDDNSRSDENMEEQLETERKECAEDLSTEDLMRVGGKLLMLPDEMLHRIFEWLYVDAYATLALVSPHWKSFTRTEAVYKRLCERLYLNQSKRRALHVSRFGNSYRTMLEKRPRVRAGGGVYVMKYTRVKPIQRDMWTEVPVGAVLEMTYYRYLYFQEDGRVLYALTAAPPHEMFRRFVKVCLAREEDPAAVWGTYQVHRNHVTVHAKQPWQFVQLEVTIQPNNVHGRYGYLSFDRHITSSTDVFDNWCSDRIDHEVPDEPFRFVKDKRL